MKVKYTTVLLILSVIVLLLAVSGCQGYQAPKYQAPADENKEAPEEVEIDVSDLEEKEKDDEFWNEIEGDIEAEEETGTETDNSEAEKRAEAARARAQERREASARRATANYKPIESADSSEESDFKKSPYRSVAEEDLPTLTVTEGDLVKLNVKATDADGDQLEYKFTTPLNSDGKWQTRAGDVGVYYSEVRVSDGKGEVIERVKIIVEPKNNKPVLEFIPNIEVDEGQTVVIRPKATDADNDKLTITYSGWMTSNTKETSYTGSNSAGVYKVVVSVTDGLSTVSQEVTVTVKDLNRLPVVENLF
jgi:hypothetical protein